MKRNQLPRLGIPWWGSLLSALILSGMITLLVLWCQPNSLRALLSGFLSQPLLIVLNYLPIALLVLLFAALFGNVFYGAALVNLAACVLSIANRIKIELRDEPVFPRDFALLREAGDAMQSYHIRYPVLLIVVVLLTTAALVTLGVFLKSKPFPVFKRYTKRRAWLFRMAAVVLCAATLLTAIQTLYADKTLYKSFRVSNASYVPGVFNELGFPYCFCCQFTTYLVEKPEGFSKSEAESWQTEARSGLGKNVHVVMIMNEAFSDVTDLSAFAWEEEDDPLANLHALQKNPHAVTGHIVVPNFGAGTANTEFDVLTGIQTNALAETTTSAMRVINRNLDSLFRAFAADGYQTSFYHPGEAWFYNRENTYRWLGAQTEAFRKDMPDAVCKGGWVTDDYMADYIEQQFEAVVAQRKLMFNYTTTIQNHMSYTTAKYGEGHTFAPVSVATPLSAESRSLLEVYTEGVRDADAMLGRLQTYFETRSEPVVLVFFGDHLPTLGEQMRAYRELDADCVREESEREDVFSPYETPYVIWANEAAAELLDWEASVASLELPANGIISASFLGQTVLELTGRSGESPWYDFLGQLRRKLPVVQRDSAMRLDETILQQDEWSEQERQDVQKWRRWSYYRLKYQQVE